MAFPLVPIQLWTSKAERVRLSWHASSVLSHAAAVQEKYESYADLFAIIKTVEKLEKARSGGRPLVSASLTSPRRPTCATL